MCIISFSHKRSYHAINNKPTLAQADADANVVLYTLDDPQDAKINKIASFSGFIAEDEAPEEENDDYILNKSTQRDIAFESYEAKANNMCMSVDWSNRVNNGEPSIAVSQSNGYIAVVQLTNDELKVIYVLCVAHSNRL